MNSPRFRAFFVALVVLAALVAGCGSSSKSSTSSSTTASGPCPFSGSTKQQSTDGAGGAETTLASVTPTVSGCIDNLAFAFAPTLAPATASYTPDQPQLVITLSNTSYAGPSTLPIGGLEYVKSISVSSKAGEVEVALTLDKLRPFLLSTSKVPAALQVAIG